MSDKEKKPVYTIEIQYLKENKWVVHKTLADFEALDKKLAPLFPNMPTLPSKGGLFGLGGDAKKQKLDLEKYICVFPEFI